MGFTAKILSWRFRHLNIVGCLLKRRPTKGGSRAPQDPPPLATPLLTFHFWTFENYDFLYFTLKQVKHTSRTLYRSR